MRLIVVVFFYSPTEFLNPMRLDRLITLQLARVLRVRNRPGSGRCLPILMYHSISDNGEPGVQPYYRVSTSPRRFAEQMACLARHGYQGVTLEEGLKKLTTGSGEKPMHVAITFDDGFRDFYTAAFPILRDLGFSATMYLPTGFIADERKRFRSLDCLSWSEVRELHRAGVQFGSHTVSHPKLHGLKSELIETELRDSKAVLESQLGESVASFAYPYAFPQEDSKFVRMFSALLGQAGYSNCATTAIGRFHRFAESPFLRRLPVNASDDDALLLAKVQGAYDWAAIPQWSFRKVRSYTRLARRASN